MYIPMKRQHTPLFPLGPIVSKVCRIIHIILAPPTAHYQQVTTVEEEPLHSFMSHTDSASLLNTII